MDFDITITKNDTIRVGKGPTGVEWVVHRREGESNAQMRRRACQHRQRLQALLTKHNWST